MMVRSESSCILFALLSLTDGLIAKHPSTVLSVRTSKRVLPRLHVLTNANKDISRDFSSVYGDPKGDPKVNNDGDLSFFTSQWFDIESKCDGDMCRIVSYDHEEEFSKVSLLIESVLRWVPVLFPFLAFQLYDPVAEIFAKFIEAIANRNWVAVDGGAYQAKIIAPAINGVVVPAISILFATLIGTTISTLRQRQLDIRTAINMEAGQLRILQSSLEAFPQGVVQDKCRYYLIQYTSRLIAEGHATVNLNALDLNGMDSELNGVLCELNRISYSNLVPPSILSQTFASCNRLYEERSKRVTALQSTFPPLHYVIVTTLALSICLAFLMETNQELLVFLNAIQLRLLWTMLVGTFCALAVVCYDLGNPFRGSYQISGSVDQIHTIRDGLRASLIKSRSSDWNHDN